MRNWIYAGMMLAAGLMLAARDAQARPATPALDELIVTAIGVPTPITRLGLAVDVITAADIARAQRVFLPDTLTSLAGVSRDQNGGAGTKASVFMRGMPTRYVGLTIDGIDMFDPVADGAIWEDMQLVGLARVETIRGANSVVYSSGAIGGLVAAYSAIGGAGESKATMEGGSFGTARAAFSTQGQAGQLDYGLAAQGFVTNGISAAAENPATDDKDGYQTQGLNGRLAYDIGAAVTLDLAFRLASGESEYDAGAAADARAFERDFTRNAYRLSTIIRWGRVRHELSATAYMSDTKDVGAADVMRDAARAQAAYQGRVAMRWGALAWGLAHKQEDYHVRGGFTAGDFDAASDSAFVLGRLDVAAHSALSLAMRHEKHDLFGAANSARVAWGLAASERLKWRGAVASGYKPPSLYQLYDPRYGNRNLEPEKSTSAELGVDYTAAAWRVSASLFAITLDNLIGYDTSFKNVQVAGATKTRGGELGVAWRGLAANYTYTDNEKPDGQRDIRRPRHMLNLQYAYDITARARLAAIARHVRDTIDTDWRGDAPKQVALDDYTLLTLGGHYRLAPNWQIYGRVENALDEDYQTAIGYNTAGRAIYIGLTSKFD